MSETIDDDIDPGLILAAEEWPLEQFSSQHRFSSYDTSIMRKLSAHGPILLRGGRGSGKSALLIASHLGMREKGNVFSVYLSLRYLPLLQSDGEEYAAHFCEILSEKISDEIHAQGVNAEFDRAENVRELQKNLSKLSKDLGKRIILLFDDAAHIGRERSLEVFFGIFRTISSSTTSCKAAIYPGVTKFGARFDVFNDSTVIDISRLDNEQVENHFIDVLRARYPALSQQSAYSDRLSPEIFSTLLARAVVGNMRAFINACNRFQDHGRVSMPILQARMLEMASDYFYPLMEEVAPKLGQYEPFVDVAQAIFEKINEASGKSSSSVRGTPPDRALIHRNIVAKFSKPFEILEYLGFIAKRDASRGLKSGGRGPVFSLNLCSLLEMVSGKRLTFELVNEWRSGQSDAVEIHVNSDLFSDIIIPEILEKDDLGILHAGIDEIAKGKVYPYGLTPTKIDCLKAGGFMVIGDLLKASDEDLSSVEGIGQATVRKVRELCYQAVWM